MSLKLTIIQIKVEIERENIVDNLERSVGASMKDREKHLKSSLKLKPCKYENC